MKQIQIFFHPIIILFFISVLFFTACNRKLNEQNNSENGLVNLVSVNQIISDFDINNVVLFYDNPKYHASIIFHLVNGDHVFGRFFLVHILPSLLRSDGKYMNDFIGESIWNSVVKSDFEFLDIRDYAIVMEYFNRLNPVDWQTIKPEIRK